MPLMADCDMIDVEAALSAQPKPVDQFAAHYSQNNYLQLLNTQNTVIGNYTLSKECSVSAHEREQIIEFISHLHHKKQYKVETFHIAVSIVDRYFSTLISEGRQVPNGNLIATISMLMAAKLEQSVSPSFNRMINLLPEAAREKVTKLSLIDLEFDILTTLEYELQWASPTLFAERYLQVLGYQNHK